jgi:hypothetical protein
MDHPAGEVLEDCAGEERRGKDIVEVGVLAASKRHVHDMIEEEVGS